MSRAGAVHEGGREGASVGEGERPTGGAEHCSTGAGATEPRDGAAQRPGAGQNLTPFTTLAVLPYKVGMDGNIANVLLSSSIYNKSVVVSEYLVLRLQSRL